MGWACCCNKSFDQTSAKLCAVAQMKECAETVSRIITFLHHAPDQDHSVNLMPSCMNEPFVCLRSNTEKVLWSKKCSYRTVDVGCEK